ncbi:MAG TPA: hypothetical protein VFE62_18245 [Gemmataceae bacterium]|nr:hypothetical protein [Gemmataceae bacterium]
MARVELDDSWLIADGDADEIQSDVRKFLKKQGMSVVDDDEGEIRAEQGSQIGTRLLGGWFVPASWLPKAATIRVKQTKKGVRIVASIEETLGFGLLDPLLASKYDSFFQRWMEDLRDLHE